MNEPLPRVVTLQRSGFEVTCGYAITLDVFSPAL